MFYIFDYFNINSARKKKKYRTQYIDNNQRQTHMALVKETETLETKRPKKSVCIVCPKALPRDYYHADVLANIKTPCTYDLCPCLSLCLVFSVVQSQKPTKSFIMK